MAEQQPSHTVSGPGQQQSSDYGRGLWVSYKVDLRTQLLSPIRSIARLLRIMPTPTDPFSTKLMLEFNNLGDRKGYNHVEGFYTSLVNIYIKRDTFKLDRRRWKIVSITIYKVASSTSVQHESIVATAKCRDATVYIRIERRIRISKVGKFFGMARSRSSKSTSKSPTADDSDQTQDSDPAAVADPSRPRPNQTASKIAADDVTYSKVLADLVKPKEEEELETIIFADSNPVFLPHLAILARSVNSFGQQYDLFGENCYWFALVMTDALKRLYSDHTVVKHGKKNAGCWNSINQIDAAKIKEVTNQVIKRFPYDCEEFETVIKDAVNNPESQIFLDEQRKREEEQRKREAAERLAAEKDRKREEADRMREEEQRRREEADRKREEEQRKREEADRKREEAERLAAEQAEELKRLRALLEQKGPQ